MTSFGPFSSRESYEDAHDASIGAAALRERTGAVIAAARAVVEAYDAQPHIFDWDVRLLDALSAAVAELDKAGRP